MKDSERYMARMSGHKETSLVTSRAFVNKEWHIPLYFYDISKD
jgi:hypothetical protein